MEKRSVNDNNPINWNLIRVIESWNYSYFQRGYTCEFLSIEIWSFKIGFNSLLDSISYTIDFNTNIRIIINSSNYFKWGNCCYCFNVLQVRKRMMEKIADFLQKFFSRMAIPSVRTADVVELPCRTSSGEFVHHTISPECGEKPIRCTADANKPKPPNNTQSNQTIRTMLASKPRNSAKPPHTPAIFLFAERTNFLSAILVKF